jgi:hypothetical protein
MAMTDADRKAQLTQLWLERPEEERTYETGPMNFYLWVRDNRPDLLVEGPGDYAYQRLRNDLFGDAN